MNEQFSSPRLKLPQSGSSVEHADDNCIWKLLSLITGKNLEILPEITQHRYSPPCPQER